MSLKDLNIEPNILLILLGSLFVMIGASGKILIERFSVAISSIGPRLFVTLLGLVMLGIGIAGPSKLFPDQQLNAPGTPRVASVVGYIADGPWFKKITGTYTGKATSSGVDYPASTTFVVDSLGGISGTYLIEESKRMMGGKLEKAKILGLGSIEFEWRDDFGHGTLRVAFSEDLNSFSGNWGDEHNLALDYKWTGKKKQ